MMLGRWWRTSVQFRLVSIFLLLSWSSVAAMGGLAFARARRELSAAALTRLDAASALKSDELRRWLDEQRRDLHVLASRVDLRTRADVLLKPMPGGAASAPDCTELRALLAPVLQEKPALREIFLLTDVGGWVVCSTDAQRVRESRALDEYYVRGRHGTFVETVYPSPITGRPLVTVATPLWDVGGTRRLGVIAAHLNLDDIDRIIRAPTGLESGSEVYLVDRFNVFVSSERFGRDRFPRGVHSPGIDSAVMGLSGVGLYASYDGTPVLGAYRWVGELGLAVIAELPQWIAFDSSRRLAWTILLTGFLSAGALALGVLFIARRITAPLFGITRAAQGVAAGDLSQRAPVVTEDEVGALARTFNDMTERLRELYDALAESAARFAQVFQASPMAIDISTLATERYIDVNPSFLRLTGYARDEVIGRTAGDLGVWADPEVRAKLMDELRARGICQDVEVRIRTKTGDIRECVAALARVTLADEPCAVCLLGDATDRKRAERALQTSQDHLRQAQKLEAIGRLAGGVAHDFNNLLTIIIGYSDHLLERPDRDATARTDLAEIRKAGLRASALTHQLLAFSRKQILAPRLVDLNAVVQDLERMLRRVVGEPITLVTRLDPMLEPVVADQAQIEQVILNLVVNARDAMPTGGTLTIETDNVDVCPDSQAREHRPAGACVRLRVRDTGTGMDADTQQHLFEPFFTTKPQGRGTGMGLAMIYGIVQQSHGFIEIESSVGEGSAFSVYLPRSDGATEAQPATLTMRSTFGSETILVVEDEEVLRNLVRDVLRTHGYALLVAGTGEEALAVAQRYEGPIDLVMSDIVLPGMSGLELVDRVAKVRPRAKVLLMSGYADETIARHGVLDPAVPFLQKPFQLHDLTHRVREVLDTGVASSAGGRATPSSTPTSGH